MSAALAERLAFNVRVIDGATGDPEWAGPALDLLRANEDGQGDEAAILADLLELAELPVGGSVLSGLSRLIREEAAAAPGMAEAAALIARSIEHDEIVHAPHSPDLHDALLVVSGDYVENGPTVEFWGEDDNGEWRVHLDGFKGRGAAARAASIDTDLDTWNEGA